MISASEKAGTVRRLRLAQLWNPLLGMAIFLVFAVYGYLKNDWVAFYGHLLGFLWWLLDGVNRIVGSKELKKALQLVRYGLIVGLGVWVAYVLSLWKL